MAGSPAPVALSHGWGLRALPSPAGVTAACVRNGVTEVRLTAEQGTPAALLTEATRIGPQAPRLRPGESSNSQGRGCHHTYAVAKEAKAERLRLLHSQWK